MKLVDHAFHLCRWVSMAWLLTAAACTGISIAPSCPSQMEVGKTGTVAANVINPGELARYAWTVVPAEAGTFEDPSIPITRFTAGREGRAVIQLVATDGLYLVMSICETDIVGSTGTTGDDMPDNGTTGDGTTGDAGTTVSLEAIPPTASLGIAVLLSCTADGDAPGLALSLTQLSGPNDVELVDTVPGSASFTATQEGDYVFQCIGALPDGSRTAPSTVTVSASGRDGGR